MGAQQGLLVALHAVRLRGGDEPRADPDPVGAEGQCGGQATTVDDAARRHHGHSLTDGVDHLGHQREGGDLARVASSLGPLGHHDVAASLHRRDGVAHLSAHADDEDVAAVAEVHHVTRNAESGHEHGAAAVDDVVDLRHHVTGGGGEQVDAEGLVGDAADLGDLVAHLLVAHGGRPHAAEAARLADGGDQAVVRHPAHPRQHHRVLHLQDVGQSSAHEGLLGPA